MSDTAFDIATAMVAPDADEKSDVRRLRAFYLPEQELIGMLGHWKETGVVTVQDYSDIPTDAKVIAVHHDWTRRGFQVVCEHESFPIHDPCSVIDGANGCLRATTRTYIPVAETFG